LKNRAPVRFHAGTAERFGRVVLLDTDEMLPGDQGFVQVVLDEPVVVLPGDRCVLRSYSPVATIGGGLVLDIRPPKHRRMTAETVERLTVLKDGTASDSVALYCREAGVRGMDVDSLLCRCGLARPELLKVLDGLTAKGHLTLVGKKPLSVAAPSVLQELGDTAIGTLSSFHKENPLVPGMRRQELLDRLAPGTSARVFQWLLDTLMESGALRAQQEYLFLPDHQPGLHQGQQEMREAVLVLYAAGGFTPPTRKEVLEQTDLKAKELSAILQLLVREQRLVKLNDDLYYEADRIQDLTEQAVRFMGQHGELTIQGFKELTGLTRKFLIPIFEYFDRSRLTIRKGDKRLPRKALD
jgi:selenocysteine-specific elongation factor